MTKISRDEIARLAMLSNLQLDDSEIDPLARDIENILTHIETLRELNTTSVEPTYQVTDLQNVWRNDEVVQSHVTGEMLVSLAAEQQDNQVKVPKVLS